MVATGESTSGVGQTITRRLNCNIRGSLKDFASGGQESACWTTQNGRINDIMGINDLLQATGDQTGTQLLKTAVLQEVNLLEVANAHAVSLGVHLSCMNGKECTRTGQNYAFTCLPKSHNANPLCLYKNDATSADSVMWRASYPEYNSENLESHNVLNVTGEPYVFVSKAHPVIDLLRANKDVLNANIDDSTMIDGQWFKVTRQVMSTCCQQLRSKILEKIGTVDLNEIRVQISRLDGLNWKEMQCGDELMSTLPVRLSQPMGACPHPENSEQKTIFEQERANRAQELTASMTELLDKKNSFTCRLELKFELLPTLVGS